ncbi:hypothetical protein PCK2_000043 [Pneumocystis canis]|nr:hypothetical protein PCK2_000043 [Pneumocystis canis]
MVFISSLTNIREDDLTTLYSLESKTKKDLESEKKITTIEPIKVNTICNCILRVLETYSDQEYIESILTAHLSKIPTDYVSALKLIINLKNTNLSTAEKAVKYICVLEDVNLLYNHALGIQSSIPKAHSKDGEYWIYPSERMFFQAMRRKNWNPEAEQMQYIVPIHNAVNERVWYEILKWEDGQGSEHCGGPKLIRFEGKSTQMSPKARWLKFLGYKPPFDRHDWKIDRCGKEVDYIIDFYSGKEKEDMLSFYLDVRPKLNINGAWMRLSRGFRNFFQKNNL